MLQQEMPETFVHNREKKRTLSIIVNLCIFKSPGMDLAHLQTGISGVFVCVLNFENLYFLGTGQNCCIFCVFK